MANTTKTISGSQKYIRTSVQKLTDVTRAIKGMPLDTMRMQLAQMNKTAARRILETLNQTVANATHNFGVSEDRLKVDQILVLRGPHYKRFRAVSRGQGHAILKKTSHVVIHLKTIEPKNVETANTEEIKTITAPAEKTESVKTVKKTTKTIKKATKEAKA